MDHGDLLDSAILARQLKRAAGVTDSATLEAWLQQMPPTLAAQIGKLLEAVHGSYVQLDRDLQLRSRSLALSSAELTQANERLRQETQNQRTAILTLQQTANSLLEKAGLPPIHQEDQNLAALSALMKQLAHDRENALKESRQSNERLELVMDSTEDGLWDWNIAEHSVYFSPRWFSMLGYEAGELPMNADTWHDLTHPQDMTEIQPILDAHLRGLTTDYQVEFRMRHKNGEWRWIRSRGKVVRRDARNQPQRMVGTHTDVTMQRLHEQELRDKLHFVEELMEIMPTPVYFKGLDSRFLGFNRAWEIFFGRSRKNWIGHTVYDLHDPERAAFHQQLDMQLYAHGGIQTFETQVTGADGSIRDVIYSKAVFSKADGTPAGILGTITDITDRKRVERELHAAKETAEAASRAKSDFLANMSHEIRTPMNGIIGMTDLTLATELNEEQHEYLRLVKASADSLLTIINDILDFSKIEAGRLTIEQTEFEVRQTIEEIVKPLQLRAHNKGLQLFTTLDERISPTLIGDPLRLRQILVNLIGNAIKFTERGEIDISVSMDSRDALHTQLTFSVRDTGLGIAADKLGLIFESFSQADTSTTRQFGGTGLGLSISRRLAELMNGQLWVESKEGTGSTFHFSVQFREPHSEPVPAVAAPLPAAPPGAGAERRLRILLAEDNRINQTLAIRLLEKLGHEVQLAETGLQAVNLYRQDGFDLILMDVQMPEMSGFEATQNIRQLEQASGTHIPIIALTARAMHGDEQKCLEAGMDSYLTKPIDREKLQRTIAQLTQRVSDPC